MIWELTGDLKGPAQDTAAKVLSMQARRLELGSLEPMEMLNKWGSPPVIPAL